MKTVSVKLCFVALALTAFVAPSYAWNCTNSLAERVPVASGTAGTFGDGDGQLFLGVSGQGTPGQLYECEVVPPGTTPPTGSIVTNTNQSSSTSTSNSNSSSNSNSTSGSSSTSKATGGNASATGGTASIGPITTRASLNNSGNSSNTNTNTAMGGQGGAGGSVSGSGNSTNKITNTNTAQGGQGGNSNQKQGQTQTANGGSSSADGNGVGNGNNSDNTVVNNPRQTATAVSPEVFPTVPCFKGTGIAGQGPVFGFSYGGGKIDENCAELEAARQAPTRIARCKIFILNKYAQKAGVTYEDCIGPLVVPERTVELPQLVAPTPSIVVNVPSINIPAPIIIEQQVQAPLLVVKPIPTPVKHRPIKRACVQVSCPPQNAHKVWSNEEVEKLNPANQ